MSNLFFVQEYFKMAKRTRIDTLTSEDEKRLISRINYLQTQNKEQAKRIKGLETKNTRNEELTLTSEEHKRLISRINYLEMQNKEQGERIETLETQNNRNEELIRKMLSKEQEAAKQTHGSKKTISILDLPKDITRYIFSFLPQKDIFWNVAFTCKTLRCHALEFIHIVTLEIKEGDHVQNAKNLKFVLSVDEVAKSIRYILAAVEGPTTDSVVKNELLLEVEGECKKLGGKILYLKQMSSEEKVNGKSGVWNDDTLFMIWQCCPQLKNIVAWGQSFFLLA